MRVRVTVLALLVCFSLPAVGAPSEGPPLPYVDRGACRFECCTYREWTVEANTPIRTRRDHKAPLVFTAKRGETVHGVGLRPESDPKTVWWVLIENARGDLGWSEHPENFGNKDACG